MPPTPEAVKHYVLGKMMVTERPAEAIRELENAVTLSPDYAQAEIALATVYKAQGDNLDTLNCLIWFRFSLTLLSESTCVPK
jgi:cytochrome c-type biogenesis protein CcmH/NrfG